MLVRADDAAFITGNGVADHCRFVLNYDVLRINDEIENNWWFCNPEFLEYFLRRLAPDEVENNWWFCNPEFLEYFLRRLAPGEDYVLFTHNSNVDRAIGPRFETALRRPELIAWFATNVELRHPKLFSMPLGVGNPVKCDIGALQRVQQQAPPKTQLHEASFGVDTNPTERRYCIEQTGIEPAAKLPWAEYFQRLGSAYFCISPNGNGIDCYRTWQALYLRTIPIVTRSILTEQHPELPLIVLDDWSEFRSIEFSSDLYEQTWRHWDPAEISLDRYIERVSATLSRLAGS